MVIDERGVDERVGEDEADDRALECGASKRLQAPANLQNALASSYRLQPLRLHIIGLRVQVYDPPNAVHFLEFLQIFKPQKSNLNKNKIANLFEIVVNRLFVF